MPTGGREYFNQITINPPPDDTGGGGEISLWACSGDPTGIIHGNVGDRAYQVGSTTMWVCSGGTSWAEDAGPTGLRTTFTYREHGTTDVSLGVYATFALAHAAAVESVALGNIVYLVIDDRAGEPVTTAGAYNMFGIQLIGIDAVGGTVGLLPPTLTTVDGTTFTNWTLGIECLSLLHLGSAPLYTLTGTSTLRTGTRSGYAASDAPVFDAGNHSLVLIFDPYTLWTNGGLAEVASVTAPGTIGISFVSEGTIESDTIKGTGALNILNTLKPGAFDPTQTGLSGAVTITSIDPLYTPGDNTDWSGDPPSMAIALDRIAAAVAGLLAGPIP